MLSGDSNLPPTQDEETQGKRAERKGVHGGKEGGREGGSGEGRRRSSAIQWCRGSLQHFLSLFH